MRLFTYLQNRQSMNTAIKKPSAPGIDEDEFKVLKLLIGYKHPEEIMLSKLMQMKKKKWKNLYGVLAS